MLHQCFFEVGLFDFFRQTQEIEIVRVFHQFISKVALRLWQCQVEIRNGFSLPAEKVGFDLVFQNRAAPIVFNGFVNVKKGLDDVFDLFKDTYIVKKCLFLHVATFCTKLQVIAK